MELPFELSIAPVAGALAAGNCVLLKPSELAPESSALLARLLPRYVDPNCVKVVEGGVDVSTALLKQRFDHILFTGSTRVGRIVMRAAAEHLTPVTLELGGKSPAIVDDTADLEVTARRLVWGKFLNAGQVCVAPDYVLVKESIHDELVALLKKTIVEFYTENPKSSPDYGRVVNAEHHRRLMRLMKSGGTIVTGGDADEADRYIAPTLITDVPEDAELLQEEIFGPILPIVRVKDVGHAIEYVNRRAKPLALYVFSDSKTVANQVIAETSSGGVTVNGILFHLMGAELPFGGVGDSGMGKYHGKHSIDTFSNLRGVVMRSTIVDPDIAFPPLTPKKEKWLRRLV